VAKDDLQAKLLKARLAQEKRNADRRKATVKKALEEDSEAGVGRGSAGAEASPRSAVSNLLRKGETLAFPDKLRNYQQQAVLETVRNFRTGRHTLNASEVGLGKTRMAGSFANTIASFQKVLWITSKTLVPQTVKELHHLGCSVVPTGDDASLFLSLPLPSNTIFITHYEVLKRDTSLHGVKWDCVIIDEVSKLKGGASGSPTQIWKDIKHFLHVENPNAFRYFLSGTPAENRPEEVWAYLHLFDPENFDNFFAFRNSFCGVNPRTGKLTFSSEKLLNLLSGNIIRMTVENMGLTGLPSMEDPNWFTQSEFSIELDRQSSVGKAYADLAKGLLAVLDSNHALAPRMVLEQMLRMRQLLSAGPEFTYSKTEYDINGNPMKPYKVTINMKPPYPKIEAAEQLIASLQGEGQQVVVFSCFNEPLTNLKKSLDRTGFYTSQTLTGDVSIANRTQAVQDFQNGNLDVLLINKKAGAQGLNLQKSPQWAGGSSHVIHMDRWFNPAVEKQANGRIVRMDTTKPCTAQYLHVENTIDDFMQDMVDAKDAAVGQLDRGLLQETLTRFLD